MVRLESSCKSIGQPVVQMTVILLLKLSLFEQLVSVIFSRVYIIYLHILVYYDYFLVVLRFELFKLAHAHPLRSYPSSKYTYHILFISVFCSLFVSNILVSITEGDGPLATATNLCLLIFQP